MKALHDIFASIMTKQFLNQTSFYRGKVRDVYTIDNKWLVMLASNRISAFDVILPKPIPYKGQVLNQIAAYMLSACKDICPNWLISSPAPNVSIGYLCQPFKMEVVVRATLTGHAWRTYQSGIRSLCGAMMPDGMKENDFFPEPIITPSTKADAGHDEDITPDEILSQQLATGDEWETIIGYAKQLFARGSALASQRGLILADTKYEFGKHGNEIMLMDEIHTPDSSRYFVAEGFKERQVSGERQKQLSKEFVREWLIANHFMGKEGQHMPEMSDLWVTQISDRYIELYEKLIDKPFVKMELTPEEMTTLIEQELTLLAAV